MGTNFYMVPMPCTHPCIHCAQPSQVHIAKRSGAGGGRTTFSLQGHRQSPYKISPGHDGSIASWIEWKEVLRKYAIAVEDEYRHAYSVNDFIQEVEATPIDLRRRQFDWVRTHEPSMQTGESRYWLCPDGFDFTFSDFC